MTYILRFVRLGTVVSVHIQRASLLHMPTHYPGPVHCNTVFKLGFHRYGCGMQMRMRLADASSDMRFV